ncbi:hypothetical protein [Streptomonospora salina]|uniref:Uncharacterized protein n=1 Tax=Streptomonospora salina TaxID=104205 RepID=A0A841E5V7_9ACTN|nr:hypothetical protein [Streptomonospora salina]MBB5996533.1 hypothetical protein [Streptomonospora salina]
MTSIASLIISSFAAIIALAALWKTHLARFRPIATTGKLRLRIYEIENQDSTWFIPQLDVPIMLVNTGAKIGTINDIRIVARYPDIPIPNAREIFPWHCVVDSGEFELEAIHRFTWLKKARLRDSSGIALQPGVPVSMHIVLDTRWDDAVIQKIEFELQISSDSKHKWTPIERWTHHISPSVWQHLIDGTSFSVDPHTSPRKEPLDR